jgi:holin-like protein
MPGLAILLGFYFLGYILSKLFIPLPSGVLGMILLAIGLFSGWIKLAWIEDAAQFLLKNMMLFFSPIIIGVMVIFHQYQSEWIPMLVSLTIGTLLVLLFTGFSVQGIQKWRVGKKNGPL